MEVIMVMLLGYQVFMPAVDNGRFQMVWDGQYIIRINTQDGSMERCDRETFKCAKVEKKEPKDESTNP
jgi:hypothetical protein